jgi:predicted permease
MVGLMPDFFVPNEARNELNALALLFCTLVSLASGVLFGLMPALQTSRPDLTTTLKEEARGSSGGGREFTRGMLVVAEVAVSVILLVSAAVTVRSFLALQRVDLGFDPEGVVAVGLPLSPRTYDSLESRNRFAHELIERVRALPGVDAATIGNGGMPFGGPQSDYAIDGQPAADGQRLRVYLASEDYWRVLRVPIRRGRALTDREVTAGDSAAVINEAAAALWPPGTDPIGRQVHVDVLTRPGNGTVLTRENASPQVTVVGIMANARNDGIGNDVQPAVVVPYTLVAPAQRTLAVRTSGVAAPLLNAMRAQVQQLDPLQPLARPYTFTEVVANEAAQPRFTMALFAAFGMLGLMLAMAGLYSVLAYLVSMRRREIGIRMALGAQPAQIVQDVGRTGLGLVAVGLAVGGLGSVVLLRLLASQLSAFAGDGLDPLTFTMVAALLGAAALVACIVPARRAARVQPTDAMR